MDTKEQNVCLKQNDRDGHVKVKKFSKFQTMWSEVTLEPMWLGVATSFMIGIAAYKNLYLQRVCLIDLGYSEEECFYSEGDQKLAIEIESQKVLSSMMIGSGLVSGVITFAMVLFLAPWSDSSGRRKPLVVLSISGMVFSSMALLMALSLPELSAGWVIYMHSLPLAIGGNFTILLLASFSYLGDICYKTGRCVLSVMGSNSAFFALSMTIGSVLAPLLYKWIDFVGLFSICLLLEAFSLFYVIRTIKDINIVPEIPKVFDLSLPWKAVQCVLQKRKGFKRRNIILMTLVPCTNTLMVATELSLIYMYLRNRFSWTEVEYSALLTLKNIVSVIGTFFIVGVLKKKLQMKDSHIGMVGGVSQLLAAIALMVSSSTRIIYWTSVLGALARGVLVAERPILNKQIVANEQGKVCCVTTLIELFCSFLVLPLCNHLYYVTLEWFPSAFLFISVVVSAIQILCYGLVQVDEEVDDVAEEKMRQFEDHA